MFARIALTAIHCDMARMGSIHKKASETKQKITGNIIEGSDFFGTFLETVFPYGGLIMFGPKSCLNGEIHEKGND